MVMRKEKIYEGKAKIVYKTDNPDLFIQYFKDDATAFDATKKGTIKDKGVVNNRISTILFSLIEKNQIATHFVQFLSDREMLVKKVEIIKVEVTIRNVVAGGMAKLFGMEEGIVLKEPVLEYHYKEDALHDPLINEYHARVLGIATAEELQFIEKTSFKINNILSDFFAQRKLKLIDFKLEFGRYKGKILLADEISPDTCRLWEYGTNKKMDKDRFRRDLGDIEQTYQQVLKIVEE